MGDSHRILHVASAQVFGGIERMLLNLAEPADGIDSAADRFALLFDGRLRRELRDVQADVTIVGPARASRPASVRGARQRLAALIDAKRPDVMITHGPWVHAIAAPVARRAGLRLTFFAHAPVRWWHWTDRWAGSYAPDLILANSRHTAARVRGLFVASRPVQVIHPPVAPHPFDERMRERMRAALGASPAEVVLISVSRIEPGKGQRELIEALAPLRGVEGWQCWVVGDAGDRQGRRYLKDVRATIESSGLTRRVHMLGARDDVPALLAAADVFCHPNAVPEAFGLSLAEAAASGLPVVATDGGGSAEVLARFGGETVAARDIVALTRALRRLIVERGAQQRGPAKVTALEEARRARREIRVALEAGAGAA